MWHRRDWLARRWPHARAALVTLAIAIGLMDGCPIPPRKTAPEAVRPAVAVVADARKLAMTPFRPIGELFRLHQTWKLFPTARRERRWMWVETRAASGRWALVYRPNDPDHDLFAERLTYRRLRGGWNPGSRGARTAYGPFVEWLAGEIFTARPEVVRVRVRMEKIRIEPRAGAFAELGVFEKVKAERREDRARRGERAR